MPDYLMGMESPEYIQFQRKPRGKIKILYAEMQRCFCGSCLPIDPTYKNPSTKFVLTGSPRKS
jgi:hypothetical protein